MHDRLLPMATLHQQTDAAVSAAQGEEWKHVLGTRPWLPRCQWLFCAKEMHKFVEGTLILTHNAHAVCLETALNLGVKFKLVRS